MIRNERPVRRFLAPRRPLCQALLLIAASLFFALAPVRARADTADGSQHLKSPDGRIEVTVIPGPRLTYDVAFEGKALVHRRDAGDGHRAPEAGRRARASSTSSARASTARSSRWCARRRRCCPRSTTSCGSRSQAISRSPFAPTTRGSPTGSRRRCRRREVKVYGEEATFAFAASGDTGVYFPQEESFFSHNERKFTRVRMNTLAPAALASIPAVVETPVGPKIAIAESDIEDYPGLWLRGTGGPALTATFPPYPLEEKALDDRDIKVTRAADYIAITRGTRTFPWRVLGVAPADKDLASSTLVYLLESPSRIADTSWIQPGKVAWDWWNALNLQGRRLPARRQQRDLPALHRLRLAERHRVHHPRRGLVPARRSVEVGARDRHAGAARLRQEEERRHHPVGDLEDARRSVPAGAGPVHEVGREGGQGRLHAARRPAGDAVLLPGQPRRWRSARCWSTSTAASGRRC